MIYLLWPQKFRWDNNKSAEQHGLYNKLCCALCCCMICIYYQEKISIKSYITIIIIRKKSKIISAELGSPLFEFNEFISWFRLVSYNNNRHVTWNYFWLWIIFFWFSIYNLITEMHLRRYSAFSFKNITFSAVTKKCMQHIRVVAYNSHRKLIFEPDAK